MNIVESVKMALNSIIANKMRAFLTMLGIIIGISSVIAIVSLGNGGTEQITAEFEALGASSVTISVDQSKAQDTDYITDKDMQQIKEKVNEVSYVSPSINSQATLYTEDKSYLTYFTGGTTDLAYINNTEILYGRFFNEKEYEEGKAVVVIDQDNANRLFGYEDVVGETIQISQNSISKVMTIVGVSKSSSSIFGGRGMDDAPVFLTTSTTFLNSIASSEMKINSITVMADKKENSEKAGTGALNILEARHNSRGEEIYSAENAFSFLEQIDSVLGIFTTFIGAVAAISLLVGGIGVMNIMLVSVTERTREIGIRKAIGATTNRILMQFLVESIILSLIGGIIGILFGIAGAELIGLVAGIVPKISLVVIIGALLFSTAVGVFFGIYPARKAASLDPIDALRYE
ncbi:MAG: ABC transporter permease [Clostridiaceae bacterium]